MEFRCALIIVSLFAVAYMADNKKQEHGTVYDEAALKDFVFATAGPDEAKLLRVFDSVLVNAAQDSIMFHKTVAFLEKPFGDPNSQYRNENLYMGLLQAKLKSPWCDSVTKSKSLNVLYLLMQNRLGSTANDFVYTTAAGFKKRLYDLEADYILLYFYNPECDACKKIKAALINSAIINSTIKSKKLKILAMYIDRDEKLWLDHLNDMPQEWIHGRDEDEYLFKNKVYDLRAIPTLYLLDKDKKVLLKDCVDIRRVEERLVVERHSFKK